MQGAVYLSAQDRAWLQALIVTEFQKVERLMNQVQDEISALGNNVQALTATIATLRGQMLTAASAAALIASLQSELAAAHTQIDANNVTSDDLAKLADLTGQIGQATSDLQAAVTPPASTGGDQTTDAAVSGNDTVTGGVGADSLVSSEDAGGQTIDSGAEGNDALSPDVPPTAQ